MNPEDVKDLVRALPEIAGCSDARVLLEGPIYRQGVSVWGYPPIAALAVGDRFGASLHGAAAILCSLISIHLVDDILDHDPSGHFHLLGHGRAANFALAYQAAALRVLESAPVPTETLARAQSVLNSATLTTALGQELDVSEVHDEEGYWRLIVAKSSPLFGAALTLGAVLAGAPAEVSERLLAVGRCLGRFIQVSDDLNDAMKQPARADWLRPRNNLAILFALEVKHDERDRLAELIPCIGKEEALSEAQRILLRCGAVSYCSFKLLEIAREVKVLIAATGLVNPAPIHSLLHLNIAPLGRLLSQVGLDVAQELMAEAPDSATSA